MMLLYFFFVLVASLSHIHQNPHTQHHWTKKSDGLTPNNRKKEQRISSKIKTPHSTNARKNATPKREPKGKGKPATRREPRT
jgi:hypothetical protein